MNFRLVVRGRKQLVRPGEEFEWCVGGSWEHGFIVVVALGTGARSESPDI